MSGRVVPCWRGSNIHFALVFLFLLLLLLLDRYTHVYWYFK
jgi:hypothetical protein